MKNKLLIAISLLALICANLPLASGFAQEAEPGIVGLIAYIGADHNVRVLTGEEQEGFAITQDGGEDTYYLRPQFSPDGSMLAYCKLPEKDPNQAKLYITRVGEWQPILMVDKIRCYDWPSTSYDWSPDSTRIIFTLPFSANVQSEAGSEQWASYHGIWVVEVNTTAKSEVIPPPANNPLINPQWSPDGKWLSLYEYSISGSRGNLLTGHNETGTLYSWFGASRIWPGNSDWSPDSSHLVFDEIAYAGFRGAGIYIATPNGEEITKIYSNSNQIPKNPLWSPEGGTIAFQSIRPGNNPQLTLVNADGSEPRQVHTGTNSIYPSAWSPTGGQILFTTTQDDQLTLFAYNLESDSSQALAEISAQGADWSIGLVDSGQAKETLVFPEYPYSESLMIYVTPERKLVLHDANDGSELDITEALSISSFWPSPSGRRFVYGRHLVNLEFLESGELQISDTLLPAAPTNHMISWSEDENQIAFMDWRDQVWVADIAGESYQVPEAISVPSWSADSSWISYCTEDNLLMVLGGEAPPVEVDNSTNCDGDWSPSKNILAYSKSAGEGSGTGSVHLFDTESLQTKPVADQVEIMGWSPDGKFLALKSMLTESEYRLWVSTHDGSRLLELGEQSTQSPGSSEWNITDSGYLLGPYSFQPDLNAAAKIAGGVLSSARNNGQILVSNPELDLDVISCVDVVSGQGTRLLTVDRSGMPAENLPGIWGWMSPDGSKAITRTFKDGNFVNLLHDCADPTATINLPFGEFPEIGSFSEDGQHFIIALTGNGNLGQILTYNLETNEVENLPATTRFGASWLQKTEKPGIHTVTGKVTEKDGSPVSNASVFIDGILVTTTDENGNYAIIRLVPGDHVVTIQKSETSFSPSSYQIKVPPDASRVDFRASKGAPPAATEAPPDATGAYEPPLGSEPAAGGGSTLAEWFAMLTSFLDWSISRITTQVRNVILPGLGDTFGSTLPALLEPETNRMLLGGLLLGMGLLVIGIVLLRRRRARASALPAEDSQRVEAAPASSPALSDTQPTPVIQPVSRVETGAPGAAPAEATPVKPDMESQEQIETWLQRGMGLVRDGKYEQGENLFRQVAQQEPTEARAWLWLGYLAARKQEWRGSERCFKLADKFGHPNAKKALLWLEDQKTG